MTILCKKTHEKSNSLLCFLVLLLTKLEGCNSGGGSGWTSTQAQRNLFGVGDFEPKHELSWAWTC